jgi:hypothetical protein
VYWPVHAELTAVNIVEALPNGRRVHSILGFAHGYGYSGTANRALVGYWLLWGRVRGGGTVIAPADGPWDWLWFRTDGRPYDAIGWTAHAGHCNASLAGPGQNLLQRGRTIDLHHSGAYWFAVVALHLGGETMPGPHGAIAAGDPERLDKYRAQSVGLPWRAGAPPDARDLLGLGDEHPAVLRYDGAETGRGEKSEISNLRPTPCLSGSVVKD